MNAAKLTPARRITLELVAACEWTPFGAAQWGTTDWLINAGLITEAKSIMTRWMITEAGRAALSQPYRSSAEANDAVLRWRMRGENRIGRIMGWAFLRCRGGGFAARVGIKGKPSILLPLGIDPALITKRKIA